MRCSLSASRPARLASSPVRFSRFSSREPSRMSKWLLAPSSRRTSSSARRRWASAVSSSYWAAESSRAASSSAFRAEVSCSRSASARAVSPLQLRRPAQHAGGPADRAAGHGAAPVDDLAVQGHDPEGVFVLPGHGDAAVQILRHHSAAQKVIDDVLIPRVKAHQPGSQAHEAELILHALFRSSSPRMAVRGRKVARPPSRCFR